MKILNRRTLCMFLFSIVGTAFLPSSSKLGATEVSNHIIRANMIVVWKSQRKMALFRNKTILKTYTIRLGFNPIGHKKKEGDGRTPEGRYFITHHNPNSAYHLSLGINYPNKNDLQQAKKLGLNPGKDIYIHGGPKNILTHFFLDWTGGCIAVLDREIEEIYAMVPDGTVIYIYS
ncbi:MAG: L,D-transpeptidase family protein [Pseudomonadota bacterium]|nr:L,D-transpeptidase family protein [Pseudomonadota bacterium]